MSDHPKQTSGTKDLTAKTAASRISNRQKQIDAAVDAAEGKKPMSDMAKSVLKKSKSK